VPRQIPARGCQKGSPPPAVRRPPAAAALLALAAALAAALYPAWRSARLPLAAGLREE